VDGPIGLWFVIALVAPLYWGYQRFFETYAAADLPFERWASSRPVLGVVRCSEQHAAACADAVRAALSQRGALVATLAPYPWQNYRLFVEVTRDERLVYVRLVRARLLRIREPVRDVLRVTLDAVDALAGETARLWVIPTLYRGSPGQVAEHGWVVRLAESKLRYTCAARSPASTAVGTGGDAGPAQESTVESPALGEAEEQRRFLDAQASVQ
jgi:hypothetical protein